jgi:hypothetical protein
MGSKKILPTAATYRQNPFWISYNARQRIWGDYVTILDGIEPVPPGGVLP